MEPVTGNAPQPGETPRQESNPWAFSDPDTAFWRGPDDRPAAELPPVPARGSGNPSATLTPPAYTGQRRRYTGEAAGAQAAGGRDAIREITRGPRTDPAERDHDEVDDGRFNPAGYAAATPARDEPGPPDDDADVMILPEPHRNRPTLALERAPVPGQPPTGLARPPVNPPRPPSPLLENSPFWLTDEQRAERAAAWPSAATRQKLTQDGRPPRRTPLSPRRPAAGLIGLVALALLAAFFGWVSAEPFLLSVGHGDTGTVTVQRCTGDGVGRRCVGRFQAADGSYTVPRVTLLGVEADQRNPGALAAGRMVAQHSRQAYVGTSNWLVDVRWMLGFLLVVLCGLGIAGLTGTRRLETLRARRAALIMSFAGPLLLLAGFLYAAY